MSAWIGLAAVGLAAVVVGRALRILREMDDADEAALRDEWARIRADECACAYDHAGDEL